MIGRRDFVKGIAALPAMGGLSEAACRAPVSSPSLQSGIALSDARQSNDDDDNNALAELIAVGHRRILLPAGKGRGADGAYLLGTKVGVTNLAAGLQLIGDGPDKTRIHLAETGRETDTYCAFFANSASADPRDNLEGLVLSGLSLFDDSARKKGFKENQNLIWLNGVSNLLIEKVHLIGFRGDGITIGAGHFQSDRRRNFKVMLRDLVIDGIDRNNRNGVSVIDCDGFVAENVHGMNVSRPGDGTSAAPTARDPEKGLGMPGLFDFEPDNPWNVIRNVRLRKVTARNCGGSAVALLLGSNATQEIPHRNFDIEFVAEGCDQGFSHSGYRDERIGRNDAIPYDLTVSGTVRGARKAAFRLTGTYGARISLAVEDCADCYIGENSQPAVGTRDVDLTGSRFVRAGNRNGNAITVDGSTRNLRIDGLRFEDCGTAATSRCLFIRGGHHDRLTFTNNVVAGTRRMTQIAGVVGGFTGSIDRRTCLNRGNRAAVTRIAPDNF